MAQHNITGKNGEAFAAELLRKKGHEVLVCNFRFEKAEIDIVSRFNNKIVFTEVKTRTSAKFGLPEEAVSKRKQQLISKAASHYMQQNNLSNEVRFDIISLLKTKSGFDAFHIEDAFFLIDEG